MILKIYDPKEVVKPNPVRLQLAPDGAFGGIEVRVVDETGHKLTGLASFTSDGTLVLYSRVAENLGFSLGADGKIQVVG